MASQSHFLTLLRTQDWHALLPDLFSHHLAVSFQPSGCYLDSRLSAMASEASEIFLQTSCLSLILCWVWSVVVYYNSTGDNQGKDGEESREIFYILQLTATHVPVNKTRYFYTTPDSSMWFLEKTISKGLPGGAVVKNLPASAGNATDAGLIPELGISRGVGNGNLLQYSCSENLTEEPSGLESMGSQKLYMTEHTHKRNQKIFQSLSHIWTNKV